MRARGGRGRGLLSRGGRGGLRISAEPLDQAMEDALSAMISPEKDEVCVLCAINFKGASKEHYLFLYIAHCFFPLRPHHH